MTSTRRSIRALLVAPLVLAAVALGAPAAHAVPTDPGGGGTVRIDDLKRQGYNCSGGLGLQLCTKPGQHDVLVRRHDWHVRAGACPPVG